METKKCTAAPPPASTPIRVPFARCLCGIGSSAAAAAAKRAAAVTAAIVAATAAAPAYHTPPRDTTSIDANALPLSEQSVSSYMQRSHGTIEAGPTRGQGRSLGIIKTANNLREIY